MPPTPKIRPRMVKASYGLSILGHAVLNNYEANEDTATYDVVSPTTMRLQFSSPFCRDRVHVTVVLKKVSVVRSNGRMIEVYLGSANSEQLVVSLERKVIN